MCLVEKFLVDVSGETKVTNPHLQLFVHKYVSGCQVTMYYALLREIFLYRRKRRKRRR